MHCSAERDSRFAQTELNQMRRDKLFFRSYFNQYFTLACLFAALLLAGCNDDEDNTPQPAPPVNMVISEHYTGLSSPWGMAFLPDGRLLITERTGSLRILNAEGELTAPISGVPSVYANAQGGLLDVAIDPDFENNQFVYLSFAEEAGGQAGTALGRGMLSANGITDFEVLFRVTPKTDGGTHFGSRILFNGGFLYLTLGERFLPDMSQDLSNHLGAIIRINPDGSVPGDNPFVDNPEAQPEIWTWGHRNVQGAATDPATGHIWVSEMGPLHGDELNRIEAGANYGWPQVSWGDHYDGTPIPDHDDANPDYAAPAAWWNPSIAPSGMTFYTGTMFPDLNGKLLIGGLQARGLVVVEVNATSASEVDRIDLDTRCRDVKVGPDGSIYVITDQSNGRLLRIHAE